MCLICAFEMYNSNSFIIVFYKFNKIKEREKNLRQNFDVGGDGGGINSKFSLKSEVMICYNFLKQFKALIIILLHK